MTEHDILATPAYSPTDPASVVDPTSGNDPAAVAADGSVPPVRVEVTVGVSLERAFAAFTTDFDSWWPRAHHIGEHEPAEVVLDQHLGGRWFERAADGTECQWGQVLVWEPPTRLVLAWGIGSDWRYDPDPDRASRVEVRFVAESPERTRVELVHGELDRHGAGAASLRAAVGSEDGGWRGLMRRYATVAEATSA